MPEKCPQCGAEYPSGGDCWDRFGLCMAKEFEDPDTWGAVHHLTVTCYMLQLRSRFDSAQRSWSATKGAKLSEFGSIVWTRSIAGICLDDTETYRSDIKLWAMSVLKDTQVLIQNLNIEL